VLAVLGLTGLVRCARLMDYVTAAEMRALWVKLLPWQIEINGSRTSLSVCLSAHLHL
jgi:hypothetical protein